jgi:RNA polymerase sigma-70 factor (ECF subfamily)
VTVTNVWFERLSRCEPTQDELYEAASREFGAALGRLTCAYERDVDRRRELLQETHLALWRSFERYEARCSVRTRVYRVAHNVAAPHVARHRAAAQRLISFEDIELAAPGDQERETGDRLALKQLLDMIHRLKPPDAQLMLLYLEDIDSAAIGDIMGMSPAAVRVQIHVAPAQLQR